VCDRGKMDDSVNAVDERAAIEIGSDIGDEDLMQPGRERALGDHTPYRGANRMAAREQLATKSSADETRRTCDENAHVEPQEKAAFPIQSDTGF
jgi:hypothetical protein